MTARKIQKSKTQKMNNSCYVRNEGTFSTIKNDIASGNSVIGSNSNQQNKIQNLAKLIGNKNDFDSAFNQSMFVNSSIHVTKSTETAINNIHNKIDALLETSRKFVIGGREYLFDENERIFMMQEPISKKHHHNTPEGCNTCREKWKRAGDLHNSHCQFCGMSTCKKCLKKTRLFKRKRVITLDDEVAEGGEEQQMPAQKRGQICKLCDRKFLIKDMVQGTLDSITMQNQDLADALTDQTDMKQQLQRTSDKHEENCKVSEH